MRGVCPARLRMHLSRACAIRQSTVRVSDSSPTTGDNMNDKTAADKKNSMSTPVLVRIMRKLLTSCNISLSGYRLPVSQGATLILTMLPSASIPLHSPPLRKFWNGPFWDTFNQSNQQHSTSSITRRMRMKIQRLGYRDWNLTKSLRF